MLTSIAEKNDLQGTYVLLRASLNVPLKNGVVSNQFRIARALQTLHHLVEAGARVIVVAHIGRDPEETLKPVYDVLAQSLNINWCPVVRGSEVMAARNALQDGQVVLLENVRSIPEEKANDAVFAQELAALADIYVNDAFAASHREHASIVGVPQYLPSYAGLNFVMEYEELQRTFTPDNPSLFVLGGAKFETKLPLVEKFLERYQHVFIGGALVHDVLRARGLSVGKSLTSAIDLSDSPIITHERLLVPIDVVVEGPQGIRTTTPDDVQPDEIIYDAGPQTLNMLGLYAKGAKTILWNGPLGNYEKGFDTATIGLAKLVAASEGYSVVGGGDTIASIEEEGLSSQFGFLSTGGGAMLSYLEHETLPAIKALTQE